MGEQWLMAGGVVTAAGLALVSLVGQSLGLAFFKFAATDRWLAPSAALSVLLLSGAFGLLQWGGGRAAARWSALVAVAGVMLTNLTLGSCCLLGRPDLAEAEQWLTSAAARAAGIRVMPVSPVTAGVLLLMAVVLGVLALAPAWGARGRLGGLVVATLLAVYGGFYALCWMAGVTVLAVNGMPMNVVTALALTALNFAVALACGLWVTSGRLLLGSQSAGQAVLPPRERRSRHLLQAGMVALATLMTTGGFFHIRQRIRRETRDIVGNLHNVASLKVAQIAAWRTDRLGEARTLTYLPRLADRLATLAAAPAGDAGRARLTTYFEEFRRAEGFEAIVLFDRTLTPVWATPAGAAQTAGVSADLRRRAPQTREVLVEDLHLGPAGEVWMDFLTPVWAADGSTFVGAVLLRVDARLRLFPLMAQWPGLTDSAEILVFRREGEAVVCLNDVRFRAGAALQLRLPPGQLGLPAAAAAWDRPYELTAGVDYRGKPVMGVAHVVPDSPWIVVAKIDQREAYSPVQAEAWLDFWRFALGLGLLSTVIGKFWRKLQRDYEDREREAERHRQEAAERINLVPQYANDAIFLCDEDMRIIDASERVTGMYDRPPAEMRQLSLWDLRPAAATAGLRVDFAAALSERGRVYETVHQRKDGTEFPVEISARAVTVKGRPHLLSVVRDITARKQAELALRKLSQTVEQAPLSVVITDLTGAIEYVNPKFCEVSGYTPAELHGKNLRLLKSGQTPPHIYRELWETIARGQVWRGELCNRRKDGGNYYESEVIAPVLDEGGRVTHYVGLKEDITARKRTEAALVEVQERYRLIAENVGDVVWLFDLEADRFTYVSPSVFRLRGWTADEVMGQTMRQQYATPVAAERVAQLLWDSLRAFAAGDAAARSRVVEVDQSHKNGSLVPTEVVTTLLTDGRGQVTGILGVSRNIVERRRATEALRRSEEMYRMIADNTDDIIWLYDLSSRVFTYVSPAIERSLGIPSRELEGHNFSAIFAPEDLDQVTQSLSKRLAAFHAGDAALRSRVSVLPHRHRDGQTIQGEVVSTFLTDATGRVTQILGVTRDVTEKQRLSAELLQSRDLFAETVRELRVVNEVSAIMETTENSVEKLLAEIVRRLAFALRHPGDVRAEIVIDGATYGVGAEGPWVAQVVAPVMINGRAAGGVTLGYVRSHGPTADDEFTTLEREFVDNIARTVGLGLSARESFAVAQRFGAALEIKVAQRTAELELRNREIQALLQSIPDMVLRLREDGTVLHRQDAKGGSALAKLAPREGNRCVDGLPAALIASVTALGRQALTASGDVATEVEVVAADTKLILELRAAPVGAGEIVAFVRDITERKHLEAEAAAMLEKERQLSEMKTRFISVTSHEFRTPMAAILGTVELLHNHLDRLAPAKRNEMFARITKSLHHMTEMLEDILLLNRLDAGRVKVSLAPSNLQLFVPSVLEEVRLGNRDGHRFAFECEGEAAHVATDTNLLHHILSNLLTNAARYSPEGSVVTTRLQIEPARVVLSVEDQGMGVPETDRARIFEVFERGSNVGNIKGTGLGLSIVKRMTLALGGSISHAVGTDGRGSRFTLELPRPAAAPPPSP